MAFHNSLQGIMEVVVLHGSSNKLTFKLEKKHIFKKSKFKFKYYWFKKLFKKVS